MSRLRRLLPSLLLAAFSFAIAVAMAEIAVRVAAPQPRLDTEPGLYEPDPPRRYRLRPGHDGVISNLVEFDTRAAVDAMGLRSARAEGGAANEGPVDSRILVLGDSFPFGWGVEADETFAHGLEERLRAQGVAARVWNGGVPGYGLPDAVDWLEAYGLELEPDLVVLSVFLGNDLLDATETHRQVAVEGGLVAAEAPKRSLGDAVMHRSHLARLAKRAVPPSAQQRLRDLLGRPEPWAIGYLRDTIGSYALEPPPLVKEGREATRVALDRLAILGVERGFRVALVLLPDRRQLDAARWQSGFRLLGIDPTGYDPELPVRYFLRMGGERVMPTLDLMEVFEVERDRQAGSEAEALDRLYFRFDPHWTTAGHALAAEALADFVVARGLLVEPAETASSSEASAAEASVAEPPIEGPL